MLEKLNRILLSDKTVEEFHTAYQNQEFRNWLMSILPEIEDCANTEQDNPWHIYNCLDHILHAVEEINKLDSSYDPETRRLLAYTMFLHDIGKPKCKIRRYSKLYGKEVDSFFDHNLIGMEIANRVLEKFNFDRREKHIICTLIKEHDMFMFIRLEKPSNPHHRQLTDELILEKIEELTGDLDGKTMLEYLLMVGKADNLAQNPSLTTDSLHLLDVMTEMISNLNKTNND